MTISSTDWVQERYNNQIVYTRTLEDDSKLYLLKTQWDGPDHLGTHSKPDLAYFAMVDQRAWLRMTTFNSLQTALDYFKVCTDELHFYRLIELAEGTCNF